jgi:hypothetical protein
MIVSADAIPENATSMNAKKAVLIFFRIMNLQ